MKLATYKDGSRDGQLVVVSRDLASAHYATGIATRLQQVLDDWNFLSPQLEELYTALNQGKPRHAFAFDPRRCAAPLPRAFQRCSGAFCAPDGPIGQAASDDLLGPHDPVPRSAWVSAGGARLARQPGFAAIVGELDAEASRDAALESIRLLMLVQDFALHPSAAGADPSAGVIRHTAAFGPVALTPDELGDAWQGGQVHLALESRPRRQQASRDADATFQPTDIGTWTARAARGRRLRAGTIVVAPSDCPPATSDAQDLEAADALWLTVCGADGPGWFGAIDQRVAGLVADPLEP